MTGVLISHRKRFIYTKTGKTGSTSVEVYFEPWCVPAGAAWEAREQRAEEVSEAGVIGFRGGPKFRTPGLTWWNHMPAAEIKAKIGEEVWGSYFKFCVVRNPFDQVVSAYHFFGGEPGKRVAAAAAPAPEPAVLRRRFEAWLEATPMPVERDQYVIDGEFCLDDVIRYEEMGAELERICKKLDVPFRAGALPRFKTGTRPKVALREYYTDKAIEIVKRTYGWEMERFGYGVPF